MAGIEDLEGEPVFVSMRGEPWTTSRASDLIGGQPWWASCCWLVNGMYNEVQLRSGNYGWRPEVCCASYSL